jgi:hypothetical protein
LKPDPILKTNLDIDFKGNDPTWNVTGLVYLPNSNVKFSGAVNKSSYGGSCMVLVVDNLTINGTGYIFSQSQSECADAGLTMPTGQVPSRGQLVN